MHRCTGEVSVSKYDFQANIFLYNRHAKIIKHARTVVTGQPQMSMGEFVGAAAAVGGGAFVGAKVASAPAVAAGKGVLNGGIAVAKSRMGGESWGNSFKSGALNAAFTAGGTLLNSFNRRGGGGPRIGQTIGKSAGMNAEIKNVMQRETAQTRAMERMAKSDSKARGGTAERKTPDAGVPGSGGGSSPDTAAMI